MSLVLTSITSTRSTLKEVLCKDLSLLAESHGYSQPKTECLLKNSQEGIQKNLSQLSSQTTMVKATN